MKVTFNVQGVTIDEDLEKMVKVTRALIKAGLTKKSQKSIKRLLREIQKLYNIIVKTFSPFYAINNDQAFRKSFSRNYKEFKKIYLRGDVGNLDYSCKRVKEELDALKKRDSWQNRLLDIFRTETRRLEKEAKLYELESLINQWFVSDKLVYDAMRHLQDQLNQGLDDVNSLFSSGAGVRKSRIQLQMLLKDAETSFNKVKRNQLKLADLSTKL